MRLRLRKVVVFESLGRERAAETSIGGGRDRQVRSAGSVSLGQPGDLIRPAEQRRIKQPARPHLFTDEARVKLALYGRQVFHGCIGLCASYKAGEKKSAHAGETAGRVTTEAPRDGYRA